MAVNWNLIKDMPAEIAGSFQQGQKNALVMQQAGQEQQLNALKMQQAQREIASQNALTRAFQESGGDIGKAKTALMTAGQYKPAMELGKYENERDKLALETRKAKAETALKEIEYIDHALSGAKDQAGLDTARLHIAQNVGEDRAATIPQVYDPQVIEGLRQRGLSYKDQISQKHQQTMEQLKEREIEALGGYRQRQLDIGEERLDIEKTKAQRKATEEQAKLAAGPKLSAKQESMLMGAANTMDAIKEYRTTLSKFSVTDLISPDAISDVNNKYQNMLMQAKAVYDLGALTGPDEGVLHNIITSPVSFTGSITSKKALDKQADDLARLMAKAGEVATMPKERLLEKLKESTAPDKGGATGGWSVEEVK